jgi:hypothetical protein
MRTAEWTAGTNSSQSKANSPSGVPSGDSSGEVVQTVDDPKDAMARLPYDAPWTALDAAYFASEAWWTYRAVSLMANRPCNRRGELD